jgi:hypothetical protein
MTNAGRASTNIPRLSDDERWENIGTKFLKIPEVMLKSLAVDGGEQQTHKNGENTFCKPYSPKDSPL